MKGVNPHEIPTTGRYDFVCAGVGTPLRGEPEADPIIRAIIDNGPFRGKRITGRLPDLRQGQRFSAQLTVQSQAKIEGKYIDVPVDFKEADVYVTYKLSAPDQPTNPPEFRLRTKSRFER